MNLKLYNTLTRKKEEFRPIKKKEVSFYHCGPTVYWTQHLGNMRAMVLADLIVRSLNYLGYRVRLVRNYTDVGHLTSDEDEGEDKMEKTAKKEKKTPRQIAEKYIKIFEKDCQDLNVQAPWKKPLATGHIKEMIKMIKILLGKGYAYTTDLAVYFNVSKFKNYTALSGQDLEKNISEAGKAEVSDQNKKNPADFALWFFKAGVHKNAMQTWPSPFNSSQVKGGEGFPGWHLECSAMSRKYLGDTLDIHMGGMEHIPVHHTNEIAQSEAATGKKFVNYWLHNEHLTVDNNKMAKSEGTAYSVVEIKQKGYDPLALRYFFLQAHYRSKQNFTWKGLAAAQRALAKLKSVLDKSDRTDPSASLPRRGSGASLGGFAKLDKLNRLNKSEYEKKFLAGINDDFNTPQALAVAWELVKDEKVSGAVKKKLLLKFDKVLGLDLDKVELIKVPREVQKLVKQREGARAVKDWKKADELREEVRGLGFEVEDREKGTTVRRN